MVTSKFSQPIPWALGTIIGAALLAYANTFSVPFFYDDNGSIVDNPTLRHFWSWWNVFTPNLADGQTVGGRPLLNLSLALDYAVHGKSLWGYHAVNLLIHVLAALTLFGLVRRTLQVPVLTEKYGADAVLLAWGAALLWAVHPLETEAVTYIVQRAESLVSLFYLLTLYCFCRSSSAALPRKWLVLSALSCLVGAGFKEVIVSAPVVVLLYDRCFVAGSFRSAWDKRRFYYCALACTWLIEAALIHALGSRRHTVGHLLGIPWHTYVLSEFPAILHYLGLSFWPHPLVLSYGPAWVASWRRAIPAALVVLPLLGFSVWSLRYPVTVTRRWPAIGFLGLAFFLILAPTSSLIPLRDSIVEHRMYLPLAAVVSAVVLGMHDLLGRRGVRIWIGVTAVLLAGMTLVRNHDYRSTFALWSDNVSRRPLEYRAHTNLGIALTERGQWEKAIEQYRMALQLNSSDAIPRDDLAKALSHLNRPSESLELYAQALDLDPNNPEIHYSHGTLLEKQGQIDEAKNEYQQAIRLDPAYVPAYMNLSVACAAQGLFNDSVTYGEEAVRLDPANADAHYNLGGAFLSEQKYGDALGQFDEVIRLAPNDAEAHFSCGFALENLGRTKEAATEYRAALRIKPDFPRAESRLDLLGSDK